MDRAKAKSMTIKVQAVAVLFGAAVAGAALYPLDAKAVPATASPAPTPPPTAAKLETPKVEFDTTVVAAHLNTVSGPVKNQAVTPEPTPDPVAATSKHGVESWRYLGGILSSSYKRAIVVINDQQYLLVEGKMYSPDPENKAPADVEVVQIDRAFVKVKQGEVETTLNISPRQRPELTLVDPASPGRANGATAYGNPAQGGRTSAISGNSTLRQRELDRAKADAKLAAEKNMILDEMNGGGKDGRVEKGQK